MLKVGDKVPGFKGFNQDNEMVESSQYKSSNLIIYFYPKDSTPGCTTEALEFTQAKKKFANLDTQILGISKDSVSSHRNFCDKQKLSIDLLSDPDTKVAKEFGVWQEKSMYGKKSMGIVRSTFLVDKKGVIKKIWSPVKVKGHVEEVLETTKEMVG